MIEKPSCPTLTRRNSKGNVHGSRFMKRVAKTKDFAEYACTMCTYIVKVNFE